MPPSFQRIDKKLPISLAVTISSSPSQSKSPVARSKGFLVTGYCFELLAATSIAAKEVDSTISATSARALTRALFKFSSKVWLDILTDRLWVLLLPLSCACASFASIVGFRCHVFDFTMSDFQPLGICYEKMQFSRRI